ncbi:MAG TPA: hypothetical protein VMU36_03430, partial [Spirochaetia bacterium]|nr:hypothetical protein [Spirochaetia bacterium]
MLPASICAAILVAWTFAPARNGSPSFAGLILQAALFARSAPRIAAGQPDYLAPPPLTEDEGIVGPWRVGIQVGHWNIDQMPDELARLRTDTGARSGSVEEV